MAQKLAPEPHNGSKMNSGASKVLKSTVRSLKVVNRACGLVVMTTVTLFRIPAGPSCDGSASSLGSLASSPLGGRRQEGVAPWIFSLILLFSFILIS